MIKEQIKDLRRLFKTDRIHDNTSKHVLTDEEMLSIISIINTEKRDGCYEINDNILVQLKEGGVHIKDNIND